MIGRLWDLPDKPAARFVFGVAGLALITLAARLLHLQSGGIFLVYLIVVVFVSVRAGLASSVAVSLVAVMGALNPNYAHDGHSKRRSRSVDAWQS
jgi:K+-sensing histidine kinase KdpD